MRLNYVVLGSLLLGTSLAVAQPAAKAQPAAATGPGPIDPGSIPAQCQAVAAVPADAKIATPALAARIALATCGANVRFATLKLTPDDAGIKAISDAAKPSFDMLDEVIKANDPAMTAIATKARADLMVSMVVRMRNSVPPITMQTVGAALQDHDQAHAALEPKIKPWLDQAH
jgi:hypothetical protein